MLLASAVATAVLMYLSSADPLVPVLAWVAPVPILALAFRRAGPRSGSVNGDEADGVSRRAAGGVPAPRGAEGDGVRLSSTPPPVALGVAAFLAAFAGNLAWAALYRGILPLVPLAGFAVLFGLAFAVGVWATRWAAERRGAWAGVLLFPSLWVAFEFAVARWSPHGTAGSVAYSQAAFLALIQVAAWTGLSGITFLLQFVAAGLAGLLGARSARSPRWALLLVPVTILALVVAVGAWRLGETAEARRVLVGLAAIDEGMRRSQTTARDAAMPIVSLYAEAIRTLAGRQTEAIVLPEKMVGVAPGYEPEVEALLAGAADEHDVLLIAGLNLVGRKQARNVADVFSHGRRALAYDKRRLIPGLERMYVPGEVAGLYRAPGGMTGVAICKDMDFAEIGREYGRAGVGLLFVPAWDFTRDAWLHSRMAMMRGVEGGFSVARAAANGLLTGSDELGRVVAERASDDARQSMLLASLSVGRGHTFYAEHGDWFSWTAAITAALLLTAAATKRSLQLSPEP